MSTPRSVWPAAYPHRTLAILAATLLLTVLWLLSPIVKELAVLLTAIVVGVAFLFVWLRTGGSSAENNPAAGEVEASMHSALGDVTGEQLARTPILLVVGDGLEAMFDRRGNTRLIEHAGGAIWLRVDNLSDLPRLVRATSQWRGGVAPDGVVITVSPALHSHMEAFEQMLRRVRQALADASRIAGHPLPAYVGVYQRLTPGPPDGEPEWFGTASDDTQTQASRLEGVVVAAEQRSGGGAMAVHRAASLASIVPWSIRAIWEPLAGTVTSARRVNVQGIAWTDCGPGVHWEHPWERSAAAHTRVRIASAEATAQPWPLPVPFVNAIRPRAHLSVFSRAALHMLTLVAFAASLAFWAVGTNNDALLQRVRTHLEQYASVEQSRDAAMRDALKALVDDRDQLDRYERLGVPLRLSFGLYRGAHLMPPLARAIASYVPPAAPAQVITLDSMSLFDTGRASLKPGSTRRMVEAVEMIKAHPDKRVLVAGYTDNVGSADLNLKLSNARAEAVRDWLAEASGIAVTQFAIQGYGETRPIASNDSDAGRTRNRRVEITLVPDAGT